MERIEISITTPTKEQIDPCLNCDSATCMREHDYPCNDRIRYLYKLQKNERKKKTALNRVIFGRNSMPIKIEMNMPESCMGCPLTYESHFGGDLCCITHRRVQDFIFERADFCPLKEDK